MGRFNNYKNSFTNFLKTHTKLYDNTVLSEKSTKLLRKLINKNDFYLSIVTLTILNNQNRKNKCYHVGYYCSACILVLDILLYMNDNKKKIIKKYGNEDFYEIKNFLLIESQSMLYSTFKSLDMSKYPQIMMDILKYYNQDLREFLMDYTFNVNGKISVQKEFKLSKEMNQKYKNINLASLESYNKYTQKRYGYICRASILFGWILGCGNSEHYEILIKISQYFSSIVNIYRGFHNFKIDLHNCINVSHNHVVNYGIEESYQTYIYNKEKFIIDCTRIDIYTETIKDIIDRIDERIDQVIDEIGNIEL